MPIIYLEGVRVELAWNREGLKQIWEIQNPKTAKEGYNNVLAKVTMHQLFFTLASC